MDENLLRRALCICLCICLISLVSPGAIPTLAGETRARLTGEPVVHQASAAPINRILQIENGVSVDDVFGKLYRPISAVPDASFPLSLNLSFSIGSIAVQLDITKPVASSAGGFHSTLHMHARDDTQTPPFNADLVATGQAADGDTLLAGFLPACIIVKKDLLAGMTFQQAAADAQAKTAVTVTLFNDAAMVEYGLLLALITVAWIAAISGTSPGVRGDACTIKSNLEADLLTVGAANPPNPCEIVLTTPTGAAPPSLSAPAFVNLDFSFNLGPIAEQLDITKPAALPGGVFRSTLHMHTRDDTQDPVFNGDLVATGQAADPDTLLGGLFPAAIIVKQELASGMTFEQAAADAQIKTGVEVTFFQDPNAVEYAVQLALIIVVAISLTASVQPGLSGEACTIRTNLNGGLAALGVTNPPNGCTRAP